MTFKIGQVVKQKRVPYTGYRGGLCYFQFNDKIGIVTEITRFGRLKVQFFGEPERDWRGHPYSNTGSFSKTSKFLEKVEQDTKFSVEDYNKLYE